MTEAGTGRMAQWVKCLLSKHEDLSSGPQRPGKKMGMVACVSNPRAGKEEGEGPRAPLVSQPRLYVSSRFSESVSKHR